MQGSLTSPGNSRKELLSYDPGGKGEKKVSSLRRVGPKDRNTELESLRVHPAPWVSILGCTLVILGLKQSPRNSGSIGLG